MAASNAKGVTIHLLRGNATADAITPTGASKADPSVVATAKTPTGMDTANAKWIVKLASDSTGLTEIDGDYWPVANVTADTDFELVGSDTTGSAGTFAAGTDIDAYNVTTDFIALCLSTLTFNPETPATISTGTFCDPSASISSATTPAGTVTIGGYIDITDTSYTELLDWEEKGGQRLIAIELPNNGWVLMKVDLGPISFDIPLDGALAWTSTLVLAGKPRHLF